MSKPDQKTTLNTKIAKLDQAVEWFYSDDFNLDEALSNYQKATALADEIEQDLANLKNQVEVIADFANSTSHEE